ncbi:MAG: isochorismate synthase [Actinobacteria bacterium]|uniref:isochorismate synthase n=1 Tax=freshwater metagenome TaxID=449393 RepID=A0A6J6J2G5_9ZZZZ|nr:isochorismate synthase [Actinomycetota bacterium]
MNQTVGLVARTRALAVDVDLVALCDDNDMLFVTNGAGIVGIGSAARIAVPRSDRALTAATARAAFAHIDVTDELDIPGSGAVAFGAFPFDADLDGELVIPRIAIGQNADGTTWLTTITLPDDEPSEAELSEVLERATVLGTGFARDAGLHSSSNSPSTFDIRPLRSPEEWCAAVTTATERLAAGDARKVVLARGIELITDRPVSPSAVLSQLRRTFPASHLFSIDGFVGATPELLVERTGTVVRAHPMAGTAPRSGDPETDARLAAGLLASTNTKDEHRHTIDMVHDTLLPWCSYLDEEAEPSIVAVANVQHLSTRLEGQLSEPIASVLDLVGALHPTPAVGGMPRDAALALIEELEGLDRGRYAGPVGWVDAKGNGTWAVGIRSAQINGTRTRIHAGVGVVADSQAEQELAETRAKLQTMLGAIVRP